MYRSALPCRNPAPELMTPEHYYTAIEILTAMEAIYKVIKSSKICFGNESYIAEWYVN